MVKYSYNINDFALNPTLDDTYTVVNSILQDIHTATGSKYMHIGGDEGMTAIAMLSNIH